MLELNPLSAPPPETPGDDERDLPATGTVGKGGVGIRAIGATGDQGIDGILSGTAWSGLTLTYSFPTASADYGTSQGSGTGQYPDAAPFTGFTAFTQAQEGVLERAFALISGYTQLTFTAITDTPTTHAVLRAANGPSSINGAYAYLPNDGVTGGDMFFGSLGGNPAVGNIDAETIMHELGHALGLKHGQDTEGFGMVPYSQLGLEYSLMNYPSYIGSDPSSLGDAGPGSSAQTYMMSDILALQTMYGANYGNVGETLTYSWSPTTGEEFINGVSQGAPTANHIFSTVWTGGASATYDLSAYDQNSTLDLRPGGYLRFSDSQLADLGYQVQPATYLARGDVYNAYLFDGDTRSEVSGLLTGDGDNIVFGNDLADTIRLGNGTDQLWAGTGGGNYIAGSGNDIFHGGDADEIFDLRANLAASDTVAGNGGADRAIFADNYASYTFTENDGATVVSSGSMSASLQGVETLQFADRTITLPCFAAGTRIATPRGPVCVEDLCAGDAVLTASGAARPIRWIGRMRVDCRRHPRPATVQPVRIDAHAFGPGLPARDLHLSPDHAVFAAGALIPVKVLINGTSIRQLEAGAVVYFHVELDTHDVVLAEGLPVESYLDTGNRDAFPSDGTMPLHPELGPRGEWGHLAWEASAFAPLVVTGAVVERVRAALAAPADAERARAA